jgi:hypothetical protein
MQRRMTLKILHLKLMDDRHDIDDLMTQAGRDCCTWPQDAADVPMQHREFAVICLLP